jgi:hypothetical protein
MVRSSLSPLARRDGTVLGIRPRGGSPQVARKSMGFYALSGVRTIDGELYSREYHYCDLSGSELVRFLPYGGCEAILAVSKEFEKAEVAEDLELLADFVANMGIVGVKLRECVFLLVDFS